MFKKIADFIVLHDLAETIMGDVPFFTTPEIAKLVHKTKEDRDKEESEINELFLESFSGELQTDFKKYLYEFFEGGNSEEKRFFNFIDRLDPIINIWIYIHRFDKKINIDSFIIAMSDFFENPKVKDYAYNKDCLDLILFLQTKDNAKRFYNLKFNLFDEISFGKITKDLIISLLDRDNIHFV